MPVSVTKPSSMTTTPPVIASKTFRELLIELPPYRLHQGQQARRNVCHKTRRSSSDSSGGSRGIHQGTQGEAMHDAGEAQDQVEHGYTHQERRKGAAHAEAGGGP